MSKIKGKQLTDIILTPSETPLDVISYTVSATGSVKQLINKEYLDGITTSNLQEVTDIGNITDNDIEITDLSSGVIIKSPDGTRWRINIDNGGHLLVTSL